MIEGIREIGENVNNCFLTESRYVKQNKNGWRPFQEELIKVLFEREEKIIILEAPVGAGKTFIVRQLLERKEFERCPIVMSYPTKILMESQVGSFKKELGKEKVTIWPWEDFNPNKINIFIYSTDTLVEYIKRKKYQNLEDRGELIYRLFTDLEWFSKYGGIVTSPDVLYLLVQGRYKNSKRILNFLHNSIFIFDEFHCYYGLKSFIELLEYLLSKIAYKVILLSATPIKNNDFGKMEKEYGVYNISFSDSKGGKNDICFNYRLKLSIDSFNFAKAKETEKRLMNLLPLIPKPCAVIFDSIFRLRHIEKNLKNNGFSDIDFKEWSGMLKEKELVLNKNTVVLATSAIEVGIDMKFKSLVFEASYWPSAIQRLGRVGRKEEGMVIMFTRKDFRPYFKDKTFIDRDEFEKILREVLKNPKEETGDGYSFRGQSFNFILKDELLGETFIYNENLFAMYEIEDWIDDWRSKTLEEKRRILKEFQINPSKTEDLLLYDRITPFWGVLKGNLKDDYDYLYKDEIIFPTEDRNELSIKGIVFYGE